MSTGKRLLQGAAWMYGAQLVTVAVQIGYAAVTSRLVLPDGFGAYAVALSVTGLISLLATGGLGQTVSRMVDVEQKRLHSLVTYALILGLAGALTLFVTAPFWAWLWGVESSIEPIRWLAISSFVSPFLGLSTGLMARSGKFRQLATITVVSNVVGMAVGVLAVLEWKSASSLVVSAATAQLLIMIGSVVATDGQLVGVARLSQGRGDIGYSGQLTFASILSYLTGNIVKLSMARGLGSASLGYWNRAEVLTLIPFQQIQSALIRAAYPEFRHDIADSVRARVVWTDMLTLVMWLALTASAGVAVLVPPLVPILFGPGWEVAAKLAGPLAIVGGLQIVSVLLTSAIEALGRFRWIWSTDAILIALQIAAAVLIFITRDLSVAVIALILTNVVRHGWQVRLASREGYLNFQRLWKGYLAAAAFATGLGASAWGALQCIEIATQQPLVWPVVALLSIGPLALIFLLRERLPAVVLARKYGFIGRR